MSNGMNNANSNHYTNQSIKVFCFEVFNTYRKYDLV